MASSVHLTASEARAVYETLGAIAVQAPDRPYTQRFCKWNIKSCDADILATFLQQGIVSTDDYQLAIDIGELLTRKPLQLIETGFGFTRTQTVWEAVLYLYSHLSRQKYVLEPKFMLRGQRDSSWQIVSTKRRNVPGDTEFFVENLPTALKAKRQWAFPCQLQAAAQHYGFPTDLIDFTLDPDIAAFFATRGGRAGDRGAIYAVDASSEGESRTVFLPPMFRRIHLQAGLFLEGQEYQLPDEKVVFDQDGSSEFTVYDTHGVEMDLLLDEGPVGLAAAELRVGQAPEEPFDVGELENYDVVTAIVQEIGCNLLRGREVFNPEMVGHLVVSNYDWWRANIDAYLDHCNSCSDAGSADRAQKIRQYLEMLPADASADIVKALGLRMIWRREELE